MASAWRRALPSLPGLSPSLTVLYPEKVWPPSLEAMTLIAFGFQLFVFGGVASTLARRRKCCLPQGPVELLPPPSLNDDTFLSTAIVGLRAWGRPFGVERLVVVDNLTGAPPEKLNLFRKESRHRSPPYAVNRERKNCCCDQIHRGVGRLRKIRWRGRLPVEVGIGDLA